MKKFILSAISLVLMFSCFVFGALANSGMTAGAGLGIDHRVKDVEELAEICGVSPEEAAVALEATTPVMSLSANILGEDGTELENFIADDGDFDEMERLRDRIALGQAIERLDPMWRKIILLRYYRNLTQQETAERLGLSQVKISREEKKIMAHLREQLS